MSTGVTQWVRPTGRPHVPMGSPNAWCIMHFTNIDMDLTAVYRVLQKVCSINTVYMLRFVTPIFNATLPAVLHPSWGQQWRSCNTGSRAWKDVNFWKLEAHVRQRLRNGMSFL